MAVLPGIFFVYDLSPFMVNVRRKSMPFMHLITRLLAIIGGVFSILGMLDSLIYKVMKASNKGKK